MKFLVTGVAGFIGMHTASRFLAAGHEVIGVDNLDPYYDVQLKCDRLAAIGARPEFRFITLDVAEPGAIRALVLAERPDRLIHLAAQPGVRYSLENPLAYVRANLTGFAEVLEACRHGQVPHLVYASSSSVYGNNARIPFSEHDGADHPLSLYAASKRSNELMAHAYAHLFALPVTGLRFFTVYGPWGRPDMAPIRFARAICEGQRIGVYNFGHHQRDFTYIDDIVTGVAAVALGPGPSGVSAGPGQAGSMDAAISSAPFRIYNLGNSRPVPLMEFLSGLEDCLGRKADYELLPGQRGDVQDTWADCSDLERDFGYHPDTPLAEGLSRFASWFKGYYGY